MFIKNKEELLFHGNRDGRRIALNIIECALKVIDLFEAVRKLVRINNEKLIVGSLEYDLRKIRDIYVVGAGKGTLRIAEALEEILGNRIKRGLS